MRIAIFGAGGVGGTFGTRLALAGEDVRFIARGAHLAAIQRNGLTIRRDEGDLHLHPVHAADDVAAIGPVDLVLVAVKLYDTEAVAAMLPPLMGPETAVVSFQNGVTAADTMRRAVGVERVFGGVTYIMAVISEPGVITQTGALARLIFGEFTDHGAGRRTPRIEAFQNACQRAAIDAVISDDITVDIWRKFTFLTALSGVTSLLRLPLGPIRADADTRALMQAAVEEAVAVAQANGVALPDDMTAQHMARIDGAPADTGSSMLYDLSHGKRLELGWLSGALLDLGREAGVPTPIHAFITTALKLHANGQAPR